ncbi:hypothetical protein JMUB6875_75000 [Nocardia sp. JMUB6875]
MLDGFLSAFFAGLVNNVIKPVSEVIPRWLLITFAVVLAGVGIFYGGVLTGRHGAQQPSPAAAVTSTSPAPTAPKTLLGGVDLQRYCVSYRYDHVERQSCVATIDLDKACDWQYNQSGLHLKFSSSDLRSGTCYTPEQISMGGISDMDQYCHDTFRTSIGVVAAILDKWVCQTPIDPQIACIWQYQSAKVEPRQEGDILKCYK